MSRGDVAARLTAVACRGTAVSRPLEKPGIASGAGMQSVASSQVWVVAPGVATCELGVCPCSAILHSCSAARSERPKQATVPSTGCSCTRSRSTASTDFMNGILRSSIAGSKRRERICHRLFRTPRRLIRLFAPALNACYLITTPVTYSISMPARTPAKAAQGLWRSAAPVQIICLPIW
jgi:hypothetical protein